MTILDAVNSLSAGLADTLWSEFTAWLLELVTKLFNSVVNMFKDLIILFLEAVMKLLVLIFSAISAPDFLTTYSLGQLVGLLPPEIQFFITEFRLVECAGIIASGLTARIVRKVVTFGLW